MTARRTRTVRRLAAQRRPLWYPMHGEPYRITGAEIQRRSEQRDHWISMMDAKDRVRHAAEADEMRLLKQATRLARARGPLAEVVHSPRIWHRFRTGLFEDPSLCLRCDHHQLRHVEGPGLDARLRLVRRRARRAARA